MSAPESDVSWQTLRRVVRGWAGTTAELTEVTRLHGGCINTTLGLTLADGARAVMKISPHRVDLALRREAAQLRLMRSIGLPVPEVYADHLADLDEPNSYVLMEYVDGVDLSRARSELSAEEFDRLQADLARHVATLHDHCDDCYHRVAEEGELGAPYRSWPEFLRKFYDPLVASLEHESALPAECRKVIRQTHERLDELVANDDRPRLTHGDLWSHNVLAAGPDATHANWHVTAILDPNCKYAHAEAELAYLELFRTTGPAFWAEYRQRRLVDEAYDRVRRAVYQMYLLMNHAAGFGGEYVRRLAGQTERVAALV